MPLHVHKIGSTWERQISKYRSSNRKKKLFCTGFDLELLHKFIFGPPFFYLDCERTSHEVSTTKPETEANNQHEQDNLSENLHMSGNKTRAFLKWKWALGCDRMRYCFLLYPFPFCLLTLERSIVPFPQFKIIYFILSHNILSNDTQLSQLGTAARKISNEVEQNLVN